MKRKALSLFQVTYKFFTKVAITDKVLLQPSHFICRWIVGQSCFIAEILIVNYYLVVSYPQQCLTGINVNHQCVIIIAILCFLHFLGRTLNNFYKALVTIIICNKKQNHRPYKQ